MHDNIVNHICSNGWERLKNGEIRLKFVDKNDYLYRFPRDAVKGCTCKAAICKGCSCFKLRNGCSKKTCKTCPCYHGSKPAAVKDPMPMDTENSEAQAAIGRKFCLFILFTASVLVNLNEIIDSYLTYHLRPLDAISIATTDIEDESDGSEFQTLSSDEEREEVEYDSEFEASCHESDKED